MALLRRLTILAVGLVLLASGPAAQAAASYTIPDGSGGVKVYRSVTYVQSIDLYKTFYSASTYSFGQQASIYWTFRRYLEDYAPGYQYFRAYLRGTDGRVYAASVKDLKGTLQVRTSSGTWTGVCAGKLEVTAGLGSRSDEYSMKFPRRCLNNAGGFRVYQAWSRYYRDGRLASQDVSKPATTPYVRW